MKKTITHGDKNRKALEKEVVAPSANTLDFLKAFARSYHAEKSLPDSLSGYCMN